MIEIHLVCSKSTIVLQSRVKQGPRVVVSTLTTATLVRLVLLVLVSITSFPHGAFF